MASRVDIVQAMPPAVLAATLLHVTADWTDEQFEDMVTATRYPDVAGTRGDDDDWWRAIR